MAAASGRPERVGSQRQVAGMVFAPSAVGNRVGIVSLALVSLLFVGSIPVFAGDHAQLTPPHWDEGVDTDADGRFDVLRVWVNVTATLAEIYYFDAILADAQNQTTLSYSSAYRFLSGPGTVPLSFYGLSIGESGIDGPYLVNLWLRDFSGLQGFDQHVTRAYSHTEFEGQQLELSPPHGDLGIDADGDASYDFLQILVSVRVNDAGRYRVSANVRDRFGMPVHENSTKRDLSAGMHVVPVNLTGWRVGRIGDGPYSIYLTAYDFQGYLVTYGDYTTTAYVRTQFERAPVAFTPPHTDSGIDADGDGRFDLLRLSVNLQVDEKGEYRVTGSVFDPSDYWIWDAWTQSMVLTPGIHTVALDLQARQIAQSIRNGPYRVELEAHTDYSGLSADNATYVTGPYSYADFEPLAASFAGPLQDWGVDVDSDGLFEFLAVRATLDVAQAGVYHLSGSVGDGVTSAWDLAIIGRWMNTGLQSQVVYFNGERIRQQARDGPYIVSLYLLSPAASLGEASILTQPYRSIDFEPPPIMFAPPHSDVVTDADGDGLYDSLRVRVNVSVVVAGTYEVSGYLFPINWTGGSVSVYRSFPLAWGLHTVDLEFPGWRILGMGSSGEHRISLSVSVSRVSLGWDFHRPQDLNSSDFEGNLPIQFRPPYSDSVIDTDGDGTYDVLRIEAGVESESAKTVVLETYASDSAIQPLASISEMLALPAGVSTVTVDLPGWSLRRGIDGPFLVYFEIYDEGGEELADDRHITAPYRASDFAPRPVVLTPPHADRGVDTDADGQFNRLAIDVGVNVVEPGKYRVNALLFPADGFGYYGSADADLSAGSGQRTVHVEFPTGQLALIGDWGPFKVSVFVYAEDGTVIATTEYTTATSFAPDAFDRPEIRLVFPFTDAAMDRDVPPDGIPDELRVDVVVEAMDAEWINLDATLWDVAQSVPIASQGRLTLLQPGITTVPVSFPGPVIRASGIDGPYVVTLSALGPGYVSRPYTEGRHVTSAYPSADFETVSPAVLTGSVRDAATGGPIPYADVRAYNYEDGVALEGSSDEFGNYDIGVYAGEWFVTFDSGAYSLTYQSEARTLQIASPSNVADVELYPQRNNPHLVELVFPYWGLASYRAVDVGEKDNGTARHEVEWLHGDRDGFLTQGEHNVTGIWSPPPRLPDQTFGFLSVDDVAYDLVPGSESFQALDVEGAVTDPRPIRTILAGAYSPNASLPAVIRHEIALRVEYDRNWQDFSYRIVLPAGFFLVSNTSVPRVSVREQGGEVLVDPGPDILIVEDIYRGPTPHHAWIRLVVATQDSSPPAILSATATPDPTEVGQTTTISADVRDDGFIESVRVEVSGPSGLSLGNFSMTLTGSAFTYAFVPNAPGPYAFQTWALDTAGHIVSRQGTFRAVDQTPPVISSARGMPDPQELGQAVLLSASVGDNYRVFSVWVLVQAPTGGAWGPYPMAYEGGSDEYVVSRVFAEVGSYFFTVTAYDGVGLEATSFGTFEVVDTVGPTLGPISASPDPAEVGATVWVEVAAYDPSGVSSMFAEIRDAGGIVASSGLMTLVDPGVFIYSFAPRAVGTFAVSVAANDAWGNPASTDGTIAALDTTPPTADAGDDVSALAGSSVLFDGARSSDNDRVATYVWTFVESEVTVVLTGATPIHTFIKAGEYVVTLTIADPSGNEGRDHILVSVVAAKGEVIGRVTTLDGGVIPNAFVFVKDGEYVVASAQADANGSFRLPKIPPGDYTLRAEAIGFSGGEETVQVVAGEIVVATIRLAPLESPAVHVWAAVLAVSVLGLAAIGAYLQRTRRHARRPPRA